MCFTYHPAAIICGLCSNEISVYHKIFFLVPAENGWVRWLFVFIKVEESFCFHLCHVINTDIFKRLKTNAQMASGTLINYPSPIPVRVIYFYLMQLVSEDAAEDAMPNHIHVCPLKVRIYICSWPPGP